MITQTRLERLFLHFFDTHFIADKGRAIESPQLRDEMKIATRLAVACAEKVFIPAASYYESYLCRQILADLTEFLDLGIIGLAGNAINLEEYIRERQDETFYRKGSEQHSLYRTDQEATKFLPYVRRNRSATRDIGAHWDQCVADGSLAHRLRDAVDRPIPKLEARLERVPNELGSLAFIPAHVYEILDLCEASKLIQARIRSVINEGYFESYTKDLNAGVVVDLNYLASDFRIPSYGRDLSYNKMLRFVRGQDRLKELLSCEPVSLLRLADNPDWQIALSTAVTYVTQPEPVFDANLMLSSNPPSGISLIKNKDKTSMTISTPPNKSVPTTAVQVPSRSVLCVAAAQVEFDTVRAQLVSDFGNGTTKSLNGGKYYIVQFIDPHNGVHWHLAGQTFQGQVDAALTVGKIVEILRPSITLMVGMCMGMPKRKLEVGTVVVPNEVIAFDHQRHTSNGTEYRAHGDRVDNGLYRLARTMDTTGRAYKVVLDKGLASASIKIEARNSKLVEHIERSCPDAVVFDMESSGFYRAAEQSECLWVKAVADSGEAQGAANEEREQKHVVQTNVTKNALDFAIALVREYFIVEPLA
ncbi:hypothetical protein [Zoogloea sp. LCSB751]|uniref:phosphorylase family protein n=1 Tax=Zoogloea sp. LCSB751 TaxID=1965277 RepID=UPI00111625A8|nr:hypothetical protein [Zoogloea sp. LCSB751]